MVRIICYTGLILMGLSLRAASQPVIVHSPDERLSMAVYLEDLDGDTGIPEFSIRIDDRIEIASGRLGMVLGDSNGRPFLSWSKGVRLLDTHERRADATWTPVYGERNIVRDVYNELRVDLTQRADTTQRMQLQIRAYNEGIAFRYHWPERPQNQILTVVEETTSFTFPEETFAWYIPKAQTRYSKRPLADWSMPSEMPLTLELPDGRFAALLEARMVNFSRARPKTTSGPNTLSISLFGHVIETAPFSSPWRVVMVADQATDLLANNDLILNLNAPNKIEDADWIRPGKAIREITLSTRGARNLVDFASSNGLDYIHFDAGWYGHEYEVASDATTVTVDPHRNPKGDLDLHEAIRYAKSKDLGVFVYVNHRALERQLDEILPLYKSWGIDGIKFGFVHVGSHRWTTWLYEAVRKAADHQLLVNVHDEFRPTGASRTWPNLMTQEGIRGNEEMPDATHNTVLPFTRFLSGAADYTPAYYFREEFGHPRRHIQTTPAHQLALPVIYYSPLQWLYWYDVPSRDYQGEPEVEFWAHCPTIWDETRVLQGEIGEYAVVARRSGEDWFLGAITNTDARILTISLEFLDSVRNYTATRYADGGEEVPTRTHVRISRSHVTSDSVITLDLKASGGEAIRFVPED